MTEDEREAYEERAAIMEYDGMLSREEAEKQARTRVVDWEALARFGQIWWEIEGKERRSAEEG